MGQYWVVLIVAMKPAIFLKFVQAVRAYQQEIALGSLYHIVQAMKAGSDPYEAGGSAFFEVNIGGREGK